MTVGVGLVCADGVIVASDSLSTSGTVARHGVKVHAFEHGPVVWTASGAVYVIEDVEAALAQLDTQLVDDGENPTKRAFLTPELPAVRRRVGAAIHDAVDKCYESALPHGKHTGNPQTGQHIFNSDFLVLGYSNTTPYFLEYAGDGQMNWHTDAGFYAVGSGGPFATVARGLMEHYTEGDPVPVVDGLCIAYRAIETTCRVSSGAVGVGGRVQLAVATVDGARVLTTEEVDQVRTEVEGWMTLEKDTLLRRRASGLTPEALPTVDGVARTAAD